MYRLPSKRAQVLKLVAVYSLMTIAVTMLVTFLVFVMLGYRFNQATSSIQQGGLVQLASRPEGAKVTIGNAQLGSLTPTKVTANPGNYMVKMSRHGYLDWTKSADVKSGQVLWLNYTQLVPTAVKTTHLTKFPGVVAAKSSPNGDRFALVTDPAQPTVTFVDITGSEPRQTILTIPPSALRQDKTPVVGLGDWANDSDHIVVTLRYDTGVEYVVVDRRAADRAVNISEAYQSDIAEAIFDPRSSDRVIVRSATGEVRLIDTGDRSLSSVMAQNVTQMSLLDNDAILLVRSLPEGGQSVGYVSFGSNKVREVKRIASSEKARIAIGKYFSEPYIAISTGNELNVYHAASLPSSNSDGTISMTNVYSAKLPATVDYLSIRTGGRFVVAQYTGGVQTYDLELKKQNLTSFTTPIAGELRWLDKYHFYVTTGTNLNVMEFDGNYAHNITRLATGFDAVQTDDGKYIYSIDTDGSGFALQRSRMILP